jgi:hypothetical protein
MNGVIDWGDFIPNSSGGSNDGGRMDFLWLKSGNTYRVRPVHKPVIFYKYFFSNEGKLRTAICKEPSTCSVKVNHPELDPPSERFAILVIDRADGKLKVMEFPKSVFLSIKAWWTATQKNPGGNDGVDWAISVAGSGKQGTKYTSTPIEASPFTNEEKQMIVKVLKDDEGNDTGILEKIFKAHYPEDIEKKLFGAWEPKGKAAAAPAAPAQAVPVAPAAPAATGGDVQIDW